MQYEEILPVTNVLRFKKKLWFTEYAFRINRWLNGDMIGPLRIDAEITRRCNLDCIFCSRKASPINLTEESKRIEMPKERWVELAKESGNLGVKNWNISGIGEPMCRADITIPVMKVLKAYDIFGELTTNGTLWDDEHIKNVVEMGWDSVCISIDAPHANTHDSLRGVKGAFRKANWTANRFAYWKEKNHSGLPSISLNVVMNKENYNKLPEMVELGHKLGTDAIFVEPMVTFSKLASFLNLGKEEKRELPHYIQRARKLGDKYDILPTISVVGVELEHDNKLLEKIGNAREILFEDGNKYKKDKILSIPCYAPWFFLMVRADGSVLHCGEWETPVDDIKNKSLREVWLGENFKKIRECTMESFLPDSCNKCRPNTINDMRQIRKSIERGRDVSCLQTEILDLLEQNARLRKELYILRKMTKKTKRLKRIEELEKYEKELTRIKNSLTFKLLYGLGNTKLGRKAKRLFKVYA